MDPTESGQVNPYGNEITETDAPVTVTLDAIRARFSGYLGDPQKVANGTTTSNPRTGYVQYDTDMNTPSRDEFELHLRHLDDRLESHMKLLDERIGSQNALYDQWRQSQEKLNDERDQRLATAVKDIQAETQAARREAVDQSRNLKTVLITTAVGTVIAIVGGIAAFNATVLSNMVASFESGKNTAASLTQTTDQLKLIQDDVSKTQAQLKTLMESAAASRPAPASAAH